MWHLLSDEDAQREAKICGLSLSFCISTFLISREKWKDSAFLIKS